jgi:hypothetical protein
MKKRGPYSRKAKLIELENPDGDMADRIVVLRETLKELEVAERTATQILIAKLQGSGSEARGKIAEARVVVRNSISQIDVERYLVQTAGIPAAKRALSVSVTEARKWVDPTVLSALGTSKTTQILQVTRFAAAVTK